MIRLSLLLVCALGAAVVAQADDRVREVQGQLKEQGFYYGEINGQSSGETTAAIRRYQIRHGLEVTGTLTAETSQSLGASAGVSPSAGAPAPAPAPKTAPPLGRPPKAQDDSDRRVLRQEEAKAQRSAPPTPPSPPTIPGLASAEMSGLFAGTPYANAPRQIQASTLRRAQSVLASRGFYRDPIDGSPGPATEEALLTFQRSNRLPLTGRLDLETLSRLNLLPGRTTAPARVTAPPPGQRVYRGIWIN